MLNTSSSPVSKQIDKFHLLGNWAREEMFLALPEHWIPLVPEALS